MTRPIDFDAVCKMMRKTLHKIEAGFTKPDADWMQIAQLFSEKQESSAVVPLLFQTDLDKDLLPRAIAAAVPRFDVDIVAFVLSAWMVSLPTDTTSREEMTKVRPKDHPDRQEMLMLAVVSADRQYVAKASIIRDGKAPPYLGEWEEWGASFESRIIDPVQAALVQRKRDEGARTDA